MDHPEGAMRERRPGDLGAFPGTPRHAVPQVPRPARPPAPARDRGLRSRPRPRRAEREGERSPPRYGAGAPRDEANGIGHSVSEGLLGTVTQNLPAGNP